MPANAFAQLKIGSYRYHVQEALLQATEPLTIARIRATLEAGDRLYDHKTIKAALQEIKTECPSFSLSETNVRVGKTVATAYTLKYLKA